MKFAALVVLLSLLLAGVARADNLPATLLFASVQPENLQALPGDTVVWANRSIRTHTVTSRTGLFDSGVISPRGGFAHPFDEPGTFGYFCKIHPIVNGTVTVARVLLSGPPTALAAGDPLDLKGRTTHAGEPIAIQADTGAGFEPVATVTAGANGRYEAHLHATRPARYRAVAGADESAPVSVAVADRRTVTLSRRRSRGRLLLHVTVSPPLPGARVAVQVRLRERFGWWTVRRIGLGDDSAALVRAPAGRVRARAVLLAPDGESPLAVSAPLTLRGRPKAPMPPSSPPAGGGHEHMRR
jgi:hypothetical protein